MSLLPYRKGNKTKFTNLLFQLIPKYEMEVTIQKKGHLCQFICSIGGTAIQSVALTLEHDTHPVPPETFV